MSLHFQISACQSYAVRSPAPDGPPSLSDTNKISPSASLDSSELFQEPNPQPSPHADSSSSETQVPPSASPPDSFPFSSVPDLPAQAAASLSDAIPLPAEVDLESFAAFFQTIPLAFEADYPAPASPDKATVPSPEEHPPTSASDTAN